MPALPGLTIAPGNVNAPNLYQDSIYDPNLVPDTIEILNGGLDEAGNWGAGDNSIPAWAVQEGTFARSWSTGFTRWEYMYASQLSNDSNINNRIIMAGLSLRVRLPWDVSCLLYGYQAWCLQDATQWDYDNNDAGIVSEYWDIRFNANGTIKTNMYAKLPHTRRSTGNAPSSDPTYSDPGDSSENRWKWVSKMGMDQNVGRGYFTMRCEGWCFIKEDDSKKAKVKLPTGSIWILALR